MFYLLLLTAADGTATLWLLACGGSTLVATLEGETECIEKGTALLVCRCSGDNGDVHATWCVDLVVINLWEHCLF